MRESVGGPHPALPGGGEDSIAGGGAVVRTPPPRWLAIWIAACVVCAIAAFLAGRLVRSPWDAAEENSRADPVVTAPVQTRTYTPPVAEAAGVAAAGTAVKVAPVVAEAAGVVVTAHHREPGAVLRSGQVLMEVNGRPIVALALPFRLYRDLHPEDSGADVRAVQQALQTIGFYSGAVDGSYGVGTARAVRDLFRSVGMAPPLVPPEAADALAEARSVLRKVQASPPGGKEETLAAARQAVADAELAAATPLPMAEIQAVDAAGSEVVSVLPVGAVPSEDNSVATLRAGVLTVTARVGVKDAAVFARGVTVQVAPTTDQRRSVAGRIAAVGEFRAADETSSLPGYDITVTLEEPARAKFGDGQAVLVRLPDRGKPTKGVAVPLVAVRESGDNHYVVVLAGSAAREVRVEVDRTADGYAFVTGRLALGERVLVHGTP